MLISFQRRLHFLSTVIMLHFLFFLYKTIVFIYEKQLINISLFLIIIIIPYLKKREVNRITSLPRYVLKTQFNMLFMSFMARMVSGSSFAREAILSRECIIVE